LEFIKSSNKTTTQHIHKLQNNNSVHWKNNLKLCIMKTHKQKSINKTKQKNKQIVIEEKTGNIL